MLRNRSATSGDMAVMIAVLTAGDTRGRCALTGRCCPVMRSIRSPANDAEMWGRTPASISYSTHANEYWSLRSSMLGSAHNCSGLMYNTVPTAVPVDVILRAISSVVTRAIPKSPRIAPPEASRMFSGFTSRCTTRRACACASASPTSRVICSASMIGNCPSRSSRSCSERPDASSITMYGRPSYSPVSYT